MSTKIEEITELENLYKLDEDLCILCKIRPGIIYDLHCEVCNIIFGQARLCEQAARGIEGNKRKLLEMFNHTH